MEPVEGETDDFPYLDGAVIAAETMGLWAQSSGFAAADVMILTDRIAPVTDKDLEAAFNTLLPNGSLTEHLILSFTGHGLTGFNDDTTYWLLSDSLNEGYQIFVEDLKRQLYFYGIRHLTIISDACRAIANTRNLQALTPRPGVKKRHGNPANVDVARFNACQDATSAFMVRDPAAGAPGKCIFSGVLAEALWGRIPEAIDGTVVDSASLGRGLRAAGKARAMSYNLTLDPGGSAFFDKVVYFDEGKKPAEPVPDLAPWPPVPGSQPVIGGPEVMPIHKGGNTDIFKSVIFDEGVRGRILGNDFGFAHRGIDNSAAFPGFPKIAKTIVEDVADTRDSLELPDLPDESREALNVKITDQLQVLEGLAAKSVREQKADLLRSELVRIIDAQPKVEGGFVVNAGVVQIWGNGASATLAVLPSALTSFTISEMDSQLLVEFADGLFAPLYFYPERVCTMLRDDTGVAALSYQPVHYPEKGALVAAEAIHQMVTGELSADELDALATRLRNEKHLNPVFGAISAHCYDVTGDVDSIRRMAAFYAMRGQAAPYDVIFMALVENDGQTAKIPEVPRETRRPAGNWPSWLVQKTNEADVRIAGRCPWLRQGWDFVGNPESAEMPLVYGLANLRPHLTAAAFTTLDQEGGKQLVNLWGLKPCL